MCRQCETNGRYLADGNTNFRYRDDCIEYDDCRCNCDGSWSCPSESGKWVCRDQCSTCSVEVTGREYPGNSTFSYRENCWEWDPCLCNCNGSWNCPRENAKWVCTDQCRTCDAEGQTVPGNTQFNFRDPGGCYLYDCDCNCNGSWSCPAERTVDTCSLYENSECYYCKVHDEKFPPNQRFTHKDGCIRYDCDCNCDGSWDCPGPRAVDTCRQDATSGCYFCDIDGERMEGNSVVLIDQDCWR